MAAGWNGSGCLRRPTERAPFGRPYGGVAGSERRGYVAGSDGSAVRQVRSAVGPVRSGSAACVPAADQSCPADRHASMWCALGHSWHHRADPRDRSRAPPEPSRAWHRAVDTGPRPRVAPAADGGPSKGHEMDRCQDPLGRPSAAANVGPLSVTNRGRESEGGRVPHGGRAFDDGMVPIVQVIDCRFVGAWRSLVAHQSGGLVVVGSNPAAPTISLATDGLSCRSKLGFRAFDRQSSTVAGRPLWEVIARFQERTDDGQMGCRSAPSSRAGTRATGRIVKVASINAFVAHPNKSADVAAKQRAVHSVRSSPSRPGDLPLRSGLHSEWQEAP